MVRAHLTTILANILSVRLATVICPAKLRNAEDSK